MIYRCDTVSHRMNSSKETAVLALLRAWRSVAIRQGREQWRNFFDTGEFDSRLRLGTGYAEVGTSFGQMIEAQVVGVLDGFLSNRANGFRDAVNASSLSPTMKHHLHFINRWRAWFTLSMPLTMQDGVEIPREARVLARCVMRNLLGRHRKPRLHRIGMIIDQRMVKLQRSARASHHDWWLRLSTLNKGNPVLIPLVDTAMMEARAGKRSLTIQVNQDHETKRLRFGILTNCTEAFVQSRRDYQPKCDSIALDMGMCTLLATSDGGLLGQCWLKRLERHDERIAALAMKLQKQGIRPNRSARYRRYVANLRGWIKSEVGRTLNRLVKLRAPLEIVTELLEFRAPGLSRRLNRLISRFGKGCVEAKLLDLNQRFGITLTKVDCAYTSQQCSSCGYVDKRNRTGQRTFRCQFCGLKRHGDVNAAINHRDRRSAPAGGLGRHRSGILAYLVARFNASHARSRMRVTGAKGRAADPRLTNPYFKAWRSAVGTTGAELAR